MFLRSKDKTKKKIKKNSIMIFLWTMIKKIPYVRYQKETKTCPMPLKIVLKSVTELIFRLIILKLLLSEPENA